MKKFLFYLLPALLLIGVGVFMIAKPDAFLGVLVIIFSVFLVIDAIKSIYGVIQFKLVSPSLKWTLGIKALINAIIGVAAIVIASANPSAVSAILVYLIAIDFLATAIVDLVDYIVLKRVDFPTGTLGVEIGISVLFAILFFIFPQFISHTAVTILAVIVICVGAMVAITGIYSLYMERTFKKFGINTRGTKSADAEFTDVQ